ncbi:hypothetical protein [Thermococcus siculi]|nr:hypothetical protein [Thermococcus siculi]
MDEDVERIRDECNDVIDCIIRKIMETFNCSEEEAWILLYGILEED